MHVKETDTLSPIHIFKELERLITKTDAYPLEKDNLIIQQDAFARLGSVDNETGSGEAFATLELGKKESDKALRYALTLADLGFLLDIEGWGQMQFSYSTIGKTNNSAARAIFATLSCLANGQVFVLHTVRGERLCAAELVFREKTTNQPTLLAIQGNYPKFLKSGSEEDYEVHILKNAYHTPLYSLKDATLLRAEKSDGSALELPRVYAKNALTPLTKQSYTDLMSVAGNDLIGVKDDKELEQTLFRMPEYWIIGAFLGVAVYFLVLRQFNAPVYLAGLLGFIGSGYFTAKVMFYKEELRLTDRKTWLTYTSDFLGKLLRLEYVYAFTLFGVVVSTSFPIYILKDSGKLVQLYELADVTTPWVSSVFFLLVGAFALALQKHWLARFSSAVLGCISIVGLFIANSLTDTSGKVATPEPQTTIAIALYLLTVSLAIAVAIQTWRSRKKNVPATSL